jgi:UDP-N-acetylglucosamine 1-carboxyvinyltransferase
MGRFIVSGGRALEGNVHVSGSKNAALPVIFASLITHGVSEIRNLPDITDVNLAIEIIEELGAKTERIRDALYIDTTALDYTLPQAEKVASLRASTYLIGAGLARFGRAELQSFGGCNFSKRPIDLHIFAAESFGAYHRDNVITCKRLTPTDLSFAKRSVGATVNALIMASSAKGVSRIYGCAEEPHIFTLIEYLKSAGARIDKLDGALCVKGNDLHGGRVSIPGDMIEAGTFLAASLVTGGDISVSGFDPHELSSFFESLTEGGVNVTVENGAVSLEGFPKKPISITTAAYPGFPTDLQPVFSVILARFLGGNIKETVWQGRFGYLSELAKLGVRYKLDECGAQIYNSTVSHGVMRATDLRGGAAGILTALSAEGRSEILSGELVLRGYERLDEKLRRLGAEIIYVSDE